MTVDGEEVDEVRVPTLEDFDRLRRTILKFMILWMVSVAVLAWSVGALAWHMTSGGHVAPPTPTAEVANGQ